MHCLSHKLHQRKRNEELLCEVFNKLVILKTVLGVLEKIYVYYYANAK